MVFLASRCWKVAFHTCAKAFVHEKLHRAFIEGFAAVLRRNVGVTRDECRRIDIARDGFFSQPMSINSNWGVMSSPRSEGEGLLH